MDSLSFGNYSILERIAKGDEIRHFDTLWTLFDKGLISRQGSLASITADGRAYLKRNKKPQFPQCRIERQRIPNAAEWIDA